MGSRASYFKPEGKAVGSHAEAERLRFYNSAAWRKLRSAFLRSHPLCARCQALGLVVEATTAHHVEERLKRPDLALSASNLEAVCRACHTAHHKAKKALS